MVANVVVLERFGHAPLCHPERRGEFTECDRRGLGASLRDQLVSSIDQLFLLRKLHGDCLELLADLVDIGGVHGNEVTELSSYQSVVGRVSLQVNPKVIFVNMSDATDLLDSTQVAARLGISVGAVYKLRTQNDLFPHPERYDGRSPLYSADAVEKFIARRSAREPSSSGRRPRLIAPGTVDTNTFSERLRQHIADGAGAPDVTTQAQLINLLSLNVVTFGQRMRGRTRWKDAELAIISERLGIDVSDANDIVNARRTSRYPRSHHPNDSSLLGGSA